jgi:hypothetical protein
MDLLFIFGTYGTLLGIVIYQGIQLHQKDVLLQRKLEGEATLSKAPAEVKSEKQEQEEREEAAVIAQREWEKSAQRGIEKINEEIFGNR